jgi:dethiobiotin synthase
VGKTVVAAALLHRYRGSVPLRYWKPIQTGIEHDDDTGEVERLAHAGPGELRADGVRLPRPISPHAAARASGSRIEIARLADVVHASEDGVRWIVEGAGGVLVPINERETMADLIVALGMPAVIAARTALGTINHTLLTLEALRRRSVEVAGIVLVGDAEPIAREAIETMSAAPVIGEMPHFDPLTCEVMASWARVGLDPDGRLRTYL